VRTGAGFDVVQAPQPNAAAALEHLRRLGARIGAVYADGNTWRFFVPPGSETLKWPPPAECLSGPSVRVPPRAARSASLDLRWITRGEPAGQLLTHPTFLWAALTALTLPATITHPESGK
jgi:hypothetical protein